MIATHSTIYPLVSYDPLDGFTSHMSHPSAFEDFGNNGQNLSLDVCEVSFNLYSLQWSEFSFLLFKGVSNISCNLRPHNDSPILRASF